MENSAEVQPPATRTGSCRTPEHRFPNPNTTSQQIPNRKIFRAVLPQSRRDLRPHHYFPRRNPEWLACLSFQEKKDFDFYVNSDGESASSSEKDSDEEDDPQLKASLAGYIPSRIPPEPCAYHIPPSIPLLPCPHPVHPIRPSLPTNSPARALQAGAWAELAGFSTCIESASYASLGLIDYSQVNMLSRRYKSLHFGAELSPGAPNRCAQTDRRELGMSWI